MRERETFTLALKKKKNSLSSHLLPRKQSEMVTGTLCLGLFCFYLDKFNLWQT